MGERPVDRVEAEELRLGWRMAGLAFTMASEVAAGALLGWVADRMAGTAPNGILVGALLGIAVGMLGFIRGGLKLNRLLTEQEQRRRRPPASPPAHDRSGVDDPWNEDRSRDDWPDAPHPTRHGPSP